MASDLDPLTVGAYRVGVDKLIASNLAAGLITAMGRDDANKLGADGIIQLYQRLQSALKKAAT